MVFKRISFPLIALLLSLLLVSCRQNPTTPVVVEEETTQLPASPEDLYGEFFRAVQMAKVFPDGKTFVDCTPKFPVDQILKAYESNKNNPEFHLKAFVLEQFDTPKQYASGFEADTSKSAAEHINSLWPILTRKADDQGAGTLIALPNPYIVPGGRFGEIYYWDSYFTMLGLQSAGKADMIQNMLDNFSYLINEIGFIPNGNRSYFMSRSQPPFFASMVELLAETKGDETYARYFDALEKEYAFWMDGEQGLLNKKADTHRRLVRLPSGELLNRYWDDRDSPRAEMYHDDVETAKETNRPAKELYRDLRAACESGWDFSSRWLRDPADLATIHTTELIPVDLNCLLYQLETTLSTAYEKAGNSEKATILRQKADQRKVAILKYCWDEKSGFFSDYDFVKQQPTSRPTLAMMFPLFYQIAEPEQAQEVAKVVEEKFLQPGGVLTTLETSGQQWDAPNGWAPLQWITIKGLRNYEETELATVVKNRWVDFNVKVYKNTGKMVEKYNVTDISLLAGGGEYPVQDGFGWTNGVLLRLLEE